MPRRLQRLRQTVQKEPEIVEVKNPFEEEKAPAAKKRQQRRKQQQEKQRLRKLQLKNNG